MKKSLIVGSMLISGLFIFSNFDHPAFAAEQGESIPQSNMSSKKIANVNNFKQLKAAIEDQTVSNIYLQSDVEMSSTLKINSKYKAINGNGHVLNANNHQIRFIDGNSIGFLSDIQLLNTDEHGIFWSDEDVTITYTNVDHSGQGMIYLPHGELILEGNISSTATKDELFVGHKIAVKKDAVVKLTSNNQRTAVDMVNPQASISVEPGAKLQINSSDRSIEGDTKFRLTNSGEIELNSTKNEALRADTNSQVDLLTGSIFKAATKDNIEEAIQVTNGSLLVHDGASLDVVSQGERNTIITGNKLLIENGANLSVINKSKDGAVFGSFEGKTNVELHSNEGVATWKRSNVNNKEPDDIYGKDFEAGFNLNGYRNDVKQTNLTSNNEQFYSKYNTGKIGKILVGEGVSSVIDVPIFNTVTDKDENLTGLGIPGATINAYVNNVLIGSGKVNDEGRWSIAINKQSAGTIIDVNQVKNGMESGFVSQVVTHLASEVMNFFKLGYWQPYGLILEGSIDSADLDLSNPSKVIKTISLVDGSGNTVESISAVNTDWYTINDYNGYQAILESKNLDSLPTGDYQLMITLEVDDFKISQPVKLTERTRQYHTIYTEIEEMNVGSHVVKTIDNNGTAYLSIR